MDIVEENPLQINEAQVTDGEIALNNKNNVGRPKKTTEINFSQQPKSIISLLLSKEKSESEECNIVINKVLKSPINPNESFRDNSTEGKLYNESDYSKQNVILQRNRIYECGHVNCTYSTKFRSNLKTHKRIHTSEQQYICDKCAFRSKYINSFKAHRRLHGNERPFSCQYCGYRCNSQSNLKKHISRKHKN